MIQPGTSSMKTVDQSFYVPRVPVAVIDCGETGEALLLRGLLENMGAVVALHQPGTPADFLLVLGQGEEAPGFIVICGHGDENGLVFGEYAPDIDTSCLVRRSMPARALAAKVDLPGRVVLGTACGTGSSEFGRAFIAGGVRAYIAPASYPEGAAALLFVHHFFYSIPCCGTEPEAAYLHAGSYDEESGKFTLQGPQSPPSLAQSR
jgi:hypothetical protein